MEPQALGASQISAIARRLAAFAASFAVSVLACPLLAFPLAAVLPGPVGNYLFFWPQLALAPNGFTHPANDLTRTYLSGGSSYAITGAFWVLVGIGLAWLLRKKRVRTTVYWTLPVSFAIAFGVAAVLRYWDIGIFLDGP